MKLLDQFGAKLEATVNGASRLILGSQGTRIRNEDAFAAAQAETAKMWEGFDASMRQPEPTWQEELDRLAHRNEEQSHLLIRWYPGYPWKPVHRWMIYQLSNRKQTPSIVLPHLEGPDPRTLGAYDKASGRYWTPSKVTRYQWDIFQETGCYAASYWVIQGEHGGHKAKFTKEESFFSMQAGGPLQPPDPGDLPYAPFDRRVLAKLEAFKRFKDYVEKGADLERDQDAAAKKMRAMLDDWMSTQIMEELDGKDALLKKAFPENEIQRVHGVSLAKLEEERREHLINDSH